MCSKVGGCVVRFCRFRGCIANRRVCSKGLRGCAAKAELQRFQRVCSKVQRVRSEVQRVCSILEGVQHFGGCAVIVLFQKFSHEVRLKNYLHLVKKKTCKV